MVLHDVGHHWHQKPAQWRRCQRMLAQLLFCHQAVVPSAVISVACRRVHVSFALPQGVACLVQAARTCLLRVM